MSDSDKHRRIRSYVLRTGRMTPGQERAFEDNWSRWGLEHADGPLDFDTCFGRTGPRVLEIGFGMGQSLVEMAAAAPEKNFVGIEVHKPGVGRLLHSMVDEHVSNIRVYCHDAVEVLRDCVADEYLDTVQIFFPDPWHKKRHHKRRIVQAAFIELLARKITRGGILHMATDWEDYAEHMLNIMGQSAAFRNCGGAGNYSPRPDYRPTTRFEQRGQRLGHEVWDLVFERV